MGTTGTYPSFVHLSIGLIGLFLFIIALSMGQYILVPLIYAIFIAIAIHPLVNWLIRWRFPRSIGIVVVMLVVSIALLGLITLIASQASHFSKDAPVFIDKATNLLNGGISWISLLLDIEESVLTAWIATTKADLINNSGSVIANSLTTAGGVIAALFLTPVYVFMVVYYQPHIMLFIHQLFGKNKRTADILSGTKNIVQKYILGLIVANGIVAVMNIIGLLILGIQYAVLLGLIGAFLNLIPYLGGLIAVAIYMFIALVTKPPEYVLYVMVLYAAIQFIDNNYIVPKIVGSTVALNALSSLLAVIFGAALWGIPGMFISIPALAIIKIILDRIDTLMPWGFLLGNGLQSDKKIVAGKS